MIQSPICKKNNHFPKGDLVRTNINCSDKKKKGESNDSPLFKNV